MKHRRRPWLLAYIMEYEAAKAHYKVRLDSKVFNKCNKELSQKWQDILSHRSSSDGEAE